MKLSLICPYFNGRHYINTFIKSIEQQEFSEEKYVELLLVNNNSSDKSLEILENWVSKYKGRIKITLLSYTNLNSSYASRNYGFKHAKGDIITFIDIDCILPNDFVKNVFKYTSHINSDFIIAGDVRLFINDYNNLFEYYDFIMGFNLNSYIRENTGVTANLTVNYKLFKKVKGFDEFESGADRNFCYKAKKKYNLAFNFVKDIYVFHPCRNSFQAHKQKINRVNRGLAIYKKNKTLALFLVHILRQFVGTIFQINQFKNIVNKRQVFKQLPILMKIKLISLILYLGAYSRIDLACKSIVSYVKN